MQTKTKTQIIYKYILEHGPMTGADAAKGLGLPAGSTATAVAYMAASGLLHIVGEVKNRYRTRIYDVVKGARFNGKGRRSGREALETAIEPSFHIEAKEGESQRAAKIRTHDEHKASLEAVVASLGGGPFGLMAAQLGAGA